MTTAQVPRTARTICKRSCLTSLSDAGSIPKRSSGRIVEGYRLIEVRGAIYLEKVKVFKRLVNFRRIHQDRGVIDCRIEDEIG